MEIETVQIKYFRSIYNEQLMLGNLNMFVGLNDAGKSNVLKALNLFFNGNTGWNEKFNFASDFNIGRRSEFEANNPPKDAREIVVSLTFKSIGESSPVWTKRWRSDGSVREVQYDKNVPKKDRNPETGFKRRSKVPAMLGKINYYYVPALKGAEYISFLVGRLSDIISEKARNDILRAAEGFEDSLSNYLKDITGNISEVLDIESLLKLPPNLVKVFEGMEFTDTNGVTLTHRGDGIRTRHIPILLDQISFLHRDLKEKSELFYHFIWGYEEPENNVELSSCFDLSEQFWTTYSDRHQILLTTHSPAFYSLPERMEPDWKQGEKGTYRYFVKNENSKSTFEAAEESELDPFFLLPAASKLIEKEREKEKQLQDQLAAQKRKNAKKPTIFVEGKSDYYIIKKLIKIFTPALIDKLIIDFPRTGDSGGGVDYVSRNLTIWALRQLNTPEAERLIAYGNFDKDGKGEAARSEFLSGNPNSTYAYAGFVNIRRNENNHFVQLYNSNLKCRLPEVLENIYSPNFWQIAEDKGWLVERRDFIQIVDREVGCKLLTTDDTLETLLPDVSLRRYITHCFDDQKKVAAAKFIHNSTKNEALEYLSVFELTLYDILKKLQLRD